MTTIQTITKINNQTKSVVLVTWASTKYCICIIVYWGDANTKNYVNSVIIVGICFRVLDYSIVINDHTISLCNYNQIAQIYNVSLTLAELIMTSALFVNNNM